MVVYLLNVQEWVFLSDMDIRGAKDAMDYKEVKTMKMSTHLKLASIFNPVQTPTKILHMRVVENCCLNHVCVFYSLLAVFLVCVQPLPNHRCGGRWPRSCGRLVSLDSWYIESNLPYPHVVILWKLLNSHLHPLEIPECYFSQTIL